MPIADTARSWTADEVRALPDDGNRYEVIEGALLVTPAPAHLHQRVVRELFRRLDEYVRVHRIGELLFSPADISYGTRTMVQPDLFVAGVAGGPPRSWSDIGPLQLAVEVLSPRTARHDRFAKRRLYQREGVPEYWIVDPDARLVERWRPADERPEVLDARLEWRPREDVAPLVLDLEAMFREAWGD